MLTFTVVAIVLVLVAIAVIARRSTRRERELDWPGAHDTSARDHHRAGGAHSSEGYGGGGGEASP